MLTTTINSLKKTHKLEPYKKILMFVSISGVSAGVVWDWARGALDVPPAINYCIILSHGIENFPREQSMVY